MVWTGSPFALQAFAEVIRSGSFSVAAKKLHLTQPALSIRVKQLETVLKEKLLNRNGKQLSLTPAGKHLLAYINARDVLDEEFVSSITGVTKEGLVGSVRIAGHFSAVHHLAVPALSELIRNNSRLQLHTIVREDDEIPALFEAGECDFALLQRPLQNEHFEHESLGNERYVLVKGTKFKTRHDVLIDSDPSDVITDEFIKL